MNLLILGLPNVGKTSIYNIICKDGYNITHETIGTTRDWHSAPLKKNNNIKIYDTPGIIVDDSHFIKDKFNNLINKIDIFVYVVDYNSKSYLIDRDIINKFRKFNKKIILIVNKDDNFKQDKDFSNFGLEKIFYVSCAHKHGIDEVLSDLLNNPVKDIFEEKINFSIGLYGKTNVGKSTLLNKLVGFDRSLVSQNPKTTTDVVFSTYKYKQKIYLIKDTAGIIKKNKIDKNSLDFFATKKTLSILDNTDLNILLLDVTQGFDNQSKKILKLIYEKSNIILLIINKIDLIRKNKKKLLSDLKDKINVEFSQSKNLYIFPISTFNIKDIDRLKLNIHKLSSSVFKNITTSKINKWLIDTTENYPHPRIKGNDVKFKYATQISNQPFTIKIFTNYSKNISNNYRRFLLNKFCKNFNIKSKMIKILFSRTNNPYN